MSSVLNRSTSMMNGGEMYLRGAAGVGRSGDGGGGGGGGTSLRDSLAGVIGARHLRESPTSSPLQIFVRAKKKINDIYQEIEEYVAETTLFLEGVHNDKGLIGDKDFQDFKSYSSKVAGIKEVLARDHMKVAFFGRTSNGKSTVINAMMGDKILPSGIGHTTNCFLQIEGIDTNEPYLTTEGSSEKQNIKGIGQLAHALCNNRLGDSTLVRIHWPKTRCPLLMDDVVLVDSPGIDVSVSLDDWIDKHCLDADVFVLVANSESTLMNTEKNFFHKVSEKLSKPNIFILQNRWDMAASEPEFLNEVRKQHLERTIGFLVEELKVVQGAQAEQRVFFVSAKETLHQRLSEAKGQPNNTAGYPEGFTSRYFEFQDFERKFEECISKTAVITKFEQHTQRGKNIANEIGQNVGNLMERAWQERDQKMGERQSLWARLDHTEKELHDVTTQMKEKICSIVEDVERRVSNALNEEIRRLSVLVDEFNEPFHPDPLVLNVFKKTLHAHVESGLGSNLRARLSSALALNIESSQAEMTNRMLALLGPAKREMASTMLPRREPFEILYRLNCENLCADFQEDIEFRFSLGLVSLVQRVLGKASSRITNSRHKENIPRSVPMTPLTPSNEPQFGLPQDDWSIISRFAVASVGSQGTMGLALTLGLMFKTVGWRLIVLTGGVYGCLYAYERLTWTNKAKERVFKKQYVDHATRKLRLIVDLTSHNCSHQVQQELSGTFARLCRLVDESTSEMQRDVRSLEREVQQLEDITATAKKHRNKAHYLVNELDIFQQTYLSSDE
ncbi:transmembrane GTPase Marf-like isoform X2 [Homarus americanus]|uniref:transmembrane GTPase Marf-like isoform X2 n=1 Tax=Homarus americanus TaxID=6706 RepID=UPI001C44C59B|nr:transmembrane GTPase Marf-like isoform X2 [Homarus americanus]